MNWKKLLSYYIPHKKLLFADLFFAILGSIVTLVIPLIIRHITEDVIYYENEDMRRSIIFFTLIMVILVLVECFANYFTANYGHVMGAKIEYSMRNEIFTHYQKLSFGFYDNHKVGQLMSRITNDLFEITELLHHGPEDLLISLIKLIGSFVILMFINIKLALAAFIIVPIMFVYAYIFNKRMKKAFKRNRARIGDINATIEDNLSGIRVVKSFAGEECEIEKFKKGNDDFLSSKKDSYRCMGQYHAGLSAFITMITVIVITSGAFLMSGNKLPPSDLITFLLYINNFTTPVRQLINFTEQYQNGITGYERFIEILNIEPEIKEDTRPVILKNIKGEIQYKNVCFRYEKDLPYVINNVNLHVKEGEYIALVGSSGVGKSTLLSLMSRFYEATSGEILLDNVNIKKLSLKQLRDAIGVVQQDVYLFAGSVYENIKYGNSEASFEDIVKAAKEANAHEFIIDLPDGYNTDIGQRGVKLSGGQKQRLSIARVFLKNPPVLIFDEATSSLDNESEKIVQDSLEKLAKNRTTFVIAHRLSTIRNAERIIVLSEKGIEEEGSHEQLMDRNGIYKSLYTLAL